MKPLDNYFKFKLLGKAANTIKYQDKQLAISLFQHLDWAFFNLKVLTFDTIKGVRL